MPRYDENDLNDDLNNELPLDEMAVMNEPPFDAEDTPPTGVFRRDDSWEAHKTNPRITDKIRTPRSSPLLNWAMYSGALLITLLAGYLYLQQNNTPAMQATAQPALIIESTLAPSSSDNATAVNQQPVALPGPNDGVVAADVVAELLTQPGANIPSADRIFRQQTAYTIAAVRPRDGVIQYTIQPGDTLDKISARFGVSKNTLGWANDSTPVNLLTPGDTLTILPVDGIYYKTTSEETILSIATKYKASPYAIIDSDYNKLQNANPSTLLPAGLSVMIPGGSSAEQLLYWSPPVQKMDKSGKVTTAIVGDQGFGSNADGGVSFGGGPGSCGFEPTNGGGPLRVPLGAGYTVVRGFFPGHTGIDLAAPTGTTVFAAANGTVIFAGWSNWGYGNSIVLAHGPNLYTLYGHLSRINVRCGQAVNAGVPIGAVGTTGNSTGPHLHFEIRPNGVPVNPVGYLAF